MYPFGAFYATPGIRDRKDKERIGSQVRLRNVFIFMEFPS